MINIVLYRPEIPANAGNIIRLSVNCGAALHFIGPLGFQLDNQHLMRAGLDYHELACLNVHVNLKHFLEKEQPARLIAATSRGSIPHSDFAFKDRDYVIFGREKEGLSEEVFDLIPDAMRVRIPMAANSRCLNLSNAVAVIAYEAYRQLGYPGAVLNGSQKWATAAAHPKREPALTWSQNSYKKRNFP